MLTPRLCYVFLIIITTCRCAKILGIFNFPSKSHHILGESLLKALADRGHEVTMLSPFKSKDLSKNYKEVVLPEVLKSKEDTLSKSMINTFNSSTSSWDRLKRLAKTFVSARDCFFNTSHVKNLIKSNQQYDLTIVSYFGDAPILALARRTSNYTIAFSTFGYNDAIAKITKVPIPLSYIPFRFVPFPDEMSFVQRMITVLVKVLIFILVDSDQGFINKHFTNPPLVGDIEKTVSLVLLNSNPSIENARPYVPNMIQVGGLHIKDAKPLEKELDDFMNEAKEGTVFFSLGSNIHVSDMDNAVVEGIINCFSKLPYNVLWKFDKVNVKNLPKNVKISNWFPQRDILAHKNLKLFITHGGLLSVTEALYHGVPMIGIPLFGDQQGNVMRAELDGYLIELQFYNLSEESLTNAILEIMNNSRYRDNARNRSRIFRDLQMKPMDTAIYWVEYVLRHSGAFHLQTSAMKLNFYQENLLDVIGFVLLFLFVSFYVMHRLTKFLFKLVCKFFCSNNQQKKLKTL